VGDGNHGAKRGVWRPQPALSQPIGTQWQLASPGCPRTGRGGHVISAATQEEKWLEFWSQRLDSGGVEVEEPLSPLARSNKTSSLGQNSRKRHMILCQR
jgi:hypothetical protein